jgi:hypothetical protein
MTAIAAGSAAGAPCLRRWTLRTRRPAEFLPRYPAVSVWAARDVDAGSESWAQDRDVGKAPRVLGRA